MTSLPTLSFPGTALRGKGFAALVGGRQCVEEVLKFNPRAKVVVASGYSADGPIKETIQAGAKGFANKPYEVRRLAQTVREVVGAGGPTG